MSSKSTLVALAPGTRIERVEAAMFWGTILTIEAILVVAFLRTGAVAVETTRYVVYPFVWINVAIWAMLAARSVPAPRRIRAIAAIVAIAYFLLLLVLPGKIGLTGDATPTGLSIRWQVPGWGPVVGYQGDVLRGALVPFEAIGYSALSYLVYLNAMRITRASLAGAVGIATCVGCSVPVLIPLLGALGGTTTSLASTAYAWSYDLGTLLFVAVVLALLYSNRRATADAMA